jgi:hypothetical protein
MRTAELTRKNLKTLRMEIDAALNEVATRNGLEIKLGNGRFSPMNASFKVDVSVVSEEGTVKTKGRMDLEVFYPELVDKNVMLSGRKTGKVVEYHSRKSKFPFIVACENGKRYKLAEFAVRNGLSIGG